MIEIKMTGMCEGCLVAELELTDNICDFYGTKKTWDIACVHYSACKTAWRKAKAWEEAKGEAET